MRPWLQRAFWAAKVMVSLKVLFLLLALIVLCAGACFRLGRLWLGVEGVPVDDTVRTYFQVGQRGGILVDRVFEHSPADHAGLMRGDVLINIDNSSIIDNRTVREVLKRRSSGDIVPLVYVRDGVTYSTKVTLDYRASQTAAVNVRSVYRYRLTFADLVQFLALGVVAGTLHGMLSSGGGALKVSLLLVFFGFEIYLAKVVSLISSGFMSISASYWYIKQGYVDKKAVRYLLPSAIFGTLVGVGFSVLLNRHVLEILLALFLIYTAVDLLYQVYRSKRHPDDEPGVPGESLDTTKSRSVLVLAGIPTGFFSAVLGITGGVISTPLQQYLLKTPFRTCIANTLVTVIFVSFVGGGLLTIEGLVRDYFSLQTVLKVALAIFPGSIVGGLIGARLNEELPLNYVKAADAAVILILAYKLLFAF